MGKKYFLICFVLFTSFFNEGYSQKWIVKDSILVFPQGFSSWLKRNNGGVDSAAPGNGNSMGAPGNIGTNQGVATYDFNKDGKMDLIFQLFPSNNTTREYLKGIFVQNSIGKYVLDTNYVIKGKGDMWYGVFGDFNGDGLSDYIYETENYHGVDSNRKYNSEMVNDNWPERVFINNGKSFDTLSLDVQNLQVLATYAADIDNDGADEIICGGRDPFIAVYKYDKMNKKFIRILTDLTAKWDSLFDKRKSDYPLFNLVGTNDKNGFTTVLRNNCQGNGNPPYCFSDFTIATYKFSDNSITQTKLNRDEWVIPVKYSKEDVEDLYKYNFHQVPSIYKFDIDNNGEEEIVAGGFYMNDYSKGKQRYAYGWKVLGLNGKDLTTQFFKDSGFDRNVDLISHGLDIDDNTDGIEIIPGTWGADGGNSIGTVGYYYRVVNGKFGKYFIRDIKHESGKILDSTYFRTMQLAKYPNFSKNKNALIMYDFTNIKRTAILYQASCIGILKPTLQTTTGTKVFSYCDGDTLKLSAASNINKGDTLKWYLDNKLVGNYNPNGILTAFNFTDSGKLYVIKTDSLGCKISSDTIALIKNPIPPAPQLIRDSANNLVSNYATNIWALDGTPLQQFNWPGTNVKLIKPTASGNYTVSTVQKGCYSLKSSYYYLITDIINISKDEFIKLAPNPFVNQLNFDFVVKGYQKLNIEVYDVATGSKVANQQNIPAGAKIQLGQLARGTYIVRVTSNDNKIAQQFKMVKL